MMQVEAANDLYAKFLYVLRNVNVTNHVCTQNWAPVMLKIHAEGELPSTITKSWKIKLQREKHHCHFPAAQG